jgi:hypothetical protein
LREENAMRLFEFFPIQDLVIDNDSLIERVFGPEFCVVDETGYLLTTKHNQNLLQRARTLCEQYAALECEGIEEKLWRLRASAEVVTQREYDLAVRREALYNDTDHFHDYSLQAGSLL